MAENGLETATLAAGCFWCVEAVFDDLKGVHDVVSGYSGGHKETRPIRRSAPKQPAMPRSCRSRFDPAGSYADLLRVFFPSTTRRSSTAREMTSVPHTARRSFIIQKSKTDRPRDHRRVTQRAYTMERSSPSDRLDKFWLAGIPQDTLPITPINYCAPLSRRRC